MEYIIKKHEALTTILPIHVYINRTNDTFVFKIKNGHKVKLQTPEAMEIFGKTQNVIKN